MSFAIKAAGPNPLIPTRNSVFSAIIALALCSVANVVTAEDKKSVDQDFADLIELLQGSWRLENTAIKDDPEHGQKKGDQVIAYATIKPNPAGTVLQWDTQFGADGTHALVSVIPGTQQIRSFHTAPDGAHWELHLSRAKKNQNNWRWKLANASFPTGQTITGNGTWKFSENGKLLTTEAKLKSADGAVIELNNRMIRLSKLTNAKELASASVRRFLRNFNTRNITELANEFMENSTRVVSLYQLPLEGRDAIADSFEERFADEDNFDAGSLDAVVANARYISENVILADGTFEILDAAGNTKRHGKWGNVLQVVDGQCKLLMESAHSEITNEAVSAEKSADRLPVPDGLTAKDDPVVPLIVRCIGRYTDGILDSDFDALAREFTPDGVQLVGNVSGPSRGYKQIAKAFAVGVGDGSPYEKTVLKAKVLGLKRIDDQIVAAYGVWSAQTTDGELIDFGQWGNVFRQSGGEAKMIMESAGGFE